MSSSNWATGYMLQAASIRLSPTVGNKDWLRANKQKVLQALPAEWTEANDPNLMLRFGFQMKLLDVLWTETFDLLIIFYWLCELGWAEAAKNKHKQDSLLIRRKR